MFYRLKAFSNQAKVFGLSASWQSYGGPALIAVNLLHCCGLPFMALLGPFHFLKSWQYSPSHLAVTAASGWRRGLLINCAALVWQQKKKTFSEQAPSTEEDISHLLPRIRGHVILVSCDSETCTCTPVYMLLFQIRLQSTNNLIFVKMYISGCCKWTLEHCCTGTPCLTLTCLCHYLFLPAVQASASQTECPDLAHRHNCMNMSRHSISIDHVHWYGFCLLYSQMQSMKVI